MKNSNNESICIRVLKDTEELNEGLAFITERYQAEFSMSPAAPDHVLAAYVNDALIGTIGLNTLEGGSLRLPYIYKFNWGRLPKETLLDSAVEFCRWISPSRKISGMLIYEAILVSLQLGKKLVWCEHSPQVNRAARMFGIIFYPVVGAEIIPEAIEDIYLNYYKKIKAELFVFDLQQAEACLRTYLVRYGVNLI